MSRRSIRQRATVTLTMASTQDLPVLIGDARIEFAVRVLKSNSRSEIRDIANQLNLSTSRFRHLFKQVIGTSPNCFLRQLRLEKAKQLVLGSFLTIKEISAQVGVNDISHFVRDYKVRFKETPTETRKTRSRVT